MLFKILEIRIKSPILVSILQALYTGPSAAIKGSKFIFETFSGCRQGGIESPVIFNIYLDFVLRCAEYEVLKKHRTPVLICNRCTLFQSSTAQYLRAQWLKMLDNDLIC